jgi:hypothetical protein
MAIYLRIMRAKALAGVKDLRSGRGPPKRTRCVAVVEDLVKNRECDNVV